jgi:hypothetical protein
MTDDQKIAQFLATKGKTVISPDVRSKSEREMYLASRGDDALIEQRRHVSTDHLGREIWVNGLGERIC